MSALRESFPLHSLTREIEWQIEPHDKTAPFVGSVVELVEEFPPGQEKHMSMFDYVAFQDAAIAVRKVVGIEQTLFHTSSTHDESKTAKSQPLRSIDSGLSVKDEHRVRPLQGSS